MLSDNALELVMSHTDSFKAKSFLKSWTDQELEEALVWFRENKPVHSGGRQKKIMAELKARKEEPDWDKSRDPFEKCREAGERFAKAWEETCMELRKVMHCG